MTPYRVIRVWVLWLLFLLTLPAFSGKTQNIQVFNGHPVRLQAASAYSLKAANKVISPFRDRKVWILRSPEPLSQARRDALRKNGVVTGLFLGNQTMLATVPASANAEWLAAQGFGMVSQLDPAWIASPGLKAEILRANPAETLRIQGMVSPGLSLTEIQQNWNPAWGEWEAAWDGSQKRISIRGNKAQIEAALQSGWLIQAEPADEELIPSDRGGLVSSRTSIVYKGNGIAQPGMKGAGVTVAVGDGGMVESHADLIARQSNLTSNRVASFGDHQDHVTGIVAGAGLLQAENQGIAPEARVVNLQTSGTISQGTMLRETMGVTLTNNSYGVPLNCSRAGNYNSTAAFIDNQLRTYPDLLHVFAAGNQGSVSCGSFPAGYQTISEGYPCAKNVLTVGSTNYLDQETWFSSRGPARDGRLKPEIVVNGNDIFSTVPADNYGIKSGTSMAAPAVTGILALLTGRYRELYPGQNPESAFLKALVCNTADDLGPANADFTFGYGRINSRRSGEVLELKQFRSATISAASVQNISLTAPAGTRGLRIMLSWTDPAASPNPFKALIQDLDLSVVAPDGQTYFPWVARVGSAAVRERDTLNNLEQVTLPVLAGQQVQVRVQAGLLPEGSQRFWLVYHWEKEELALTSPVSGERWFGQSAVPVAWDLSGPSLESLSLETSSDSANWVTAIASLSPQPGISSWTPSASGPVKVWVRLKGVSGGNIRYSAATGIWLVPRLLNFTATGCIRSGEFRWQTLPSATRYGLLELDEQKGIWVEKASATGGVLALSGMENTAGKWYAVQPWFGTLAGLRTAAVKVVPNSTPCPWAPDLGLAGLAGAQTGRLQTSAPLGTEIRVRIQNYGNQNVFQQPCTLHVKLGQSPAVQVPLFLTLAAGEQQEMTLPQSLPAGLAGTWDLFCRLEMSGDQHLENDSLRTQLRQLANEPAGLPWKYNAEGQAIAEAQDTQMGWGIPNLDVETTQGGRVKTGAARSEEDETGSRNLILEKTRLDGKTGTSEARFTLNLSAYENQELVVDFDWLPMGTLTTGNEVQVRASDQAEWISLMRFWQQTYTTGQWQRVRGLNVSSLLAGLQPGASFQIRFIQSGTRNGEIQPGGGYRIDNLVLSNPANDVYIGALLAPQTGCATANDEGHVQVRIQNPGGQSGPVRVGYRLPGNGLVQEVVQLAGDSVDYTFSTPLPAGITGPLRFTLWASADSDGYPTNDTLRNQLVYRFPTLNTLPYYEGFENGDGFWAATGKNNTWNWGTPSPNLQVLDTAANGLKIWSTSKNGVYANSQESWLQSPCFTLSDYTGDFQFSFNSRFQTEWEYDQAWLEIASGDGPWTRLGTPQDGTNWYNHDAPCWSGNRENWSGASIRIPASMLGSLTNIRFRFAFKSDISLNGEGFGIDDINIEPAFEIQNDTSFNTMGDVVETQDWISFGNLPDKVAMVENMAELGTVTMAMKINKTATRLNNEIPYLDRNYLIVPEVQPTAPVRVRLFVTDAEIRKLQEADLSLRSFQELGIFKYDGPNQDLGLENNSYTSDNSIYIAPRDVLKVPTAGGYYLEFQVDGFSEFYVATRDLAGEDTPLPVDILAFAGNTDALSGNVNLNWRTATERNLDRYELAWSCDGRSYEVFHRNAPQGRIGVETDYTVAHRPGVCGSDVRYYRLQAFDAGKASPVSERIIRVVLDGKSQVRVWTSPGENGDLHLEGLPQEETRVRIVDMRGVEVVPAVTLEGGDRVLSLRLPAGVYRVVLEGSSGRSIHPVIRTR